MGAIAIKGNPNNGSEVIHLLEMFGGVNMYNMTGRGMWSYYYIDVDGFINSDLTENFQGGKFLIEMYQFNNRWPYKVGDMIMYESIMKKSLPYQIVKMKWDEKHNLVLYDISRGNETIIGLTIDAFTPYVEGEFVDAVSTKKTDRVTFNEVDFEDEVELVLGNEYEVLLRNGKIKVVRIKQ